MINFDNYNLSNSSPSFHPIKTPGLLKDLVLTYAQWSADIVVHGNVFDYQSIIVNGVAASNVTSVLADDNVTRIGVSDSAANILSNLDALQTASLVINIAITNTDAAPLAVTYAQWSADKTALDLVNTGLTVSGVAASDAAAVLADSHVSSITVSSSGAAILSNLAALQTAATQITAITNTDAAPLAVTYAQWSADKTALDLVNTGLTVSGVAASNAAAVLADSHVSSITVSSSGAAILSNLAALQTAAAHITAITNTDAAPLAVTYAQWTADKTALDLVNTGLILKGLSAGNAATVLADSHVSSVTVRDTSAHIISALDSLETGAAHISSIIVSDSDSISVTANQLTSDADILAKIDIDTINVNCSPSNSARNMSGILGNVSFNYTKDTISTTSATHIDTITGWSDDDSIHFNSALQVAGYKGIPKSGEASINSTTGIATFHASDNTLSLEIAAVHKAIASASSSPVAGNVALWNYNGNAYALITGAHAGSGLAAHDTVIEFIGVNTSHVELHNGILIA